MEEEHDSPAGVGKPTHLQSDQVLGGLFEPHPREPGPEVCEERGSYHPAT